MASRLARTPLIHAKRTLAAQAAVATQVGEGGLVPAKVESSKLAGSGLSVVSCNTGSPLTTIGVLVKAGSRYETYDNLGVTHALSSAVYLSSKHYTSFGIVKNIQQVGTGIEAKVGRDCIMFSSQVLSGKIDIVADYLLDAIANPAFKPWEILDDLPKRMTINLEGLAPDVRAMELLHKAAYREGLGNSLFSAPHMVGKHSPILLNAFHQKHFTADRACLVGVGDIDHNKLAKLGDALTLEKGAGPEAIATKYYGGELRHDSAGEVAYVALGTDVAITSERDWIAGCLLQKVLGVGSSVKYGSGAGQLEKAIAGEESCTVSCINNGYSDGNLIGAFIVCNASSAGQVTSKVAAALRSVNVTDAEFKAAKKWVSLDTSEKMLNTSERARFLAACAAYGMSEKAILDAIPQVTLGDVQALAKKLAGAKFSMASVGNLRTVPYVDSL